MTVVLNRLNPIRHYGAGKPDSPFASDELRRPLRLAIDRSSAPGGPALDLVLELGRDGFIELWSTEDEGLDATVLIGVGPADKDTIPVSTKDKDGSGLLSGISPKRQWDRQIDEHAAKTGLPRDAVAARFLAAGALMDRVDGLIVGDVDFGPTGFLAAKANPLTPEAACALTGLVARVHGEYDAITPVGRDFFHLLATRGMLPESWRWWSACVSSTSNHDYLMNVGQSVQERAGRAIVSRDRCLSSVFGGSADAGEEAAYYFDVGLLMLSSALDGTAHVAHVAHAVKGKKYDVGWRRKQWRKDLKKSAKPLWTLTELGTPERDAIELVALLRNTIHGEGMRKVGVGGMGPRHSQLAISPEIAADLQPIIERHGGLDAWGVSVTPFQLVAPEIFVQQIVPLVVQALNSIMRVTEVELIPGANPATLLHGPPVTEELFKPALTQRLLLLAGLTP
jgi:hypothetical protein